MCLSCFSALSVSVILTWLCFLSYHIISVVLVNDCFCELSLCLSLNKLSTVSVM